jgi:hypothetical protein
MAERQMAIAVRASRAQQAASPPAPAANTTASAPGSSPVDELAELRRKLEAAETENQLLRQKMESLDRLVREKNSDQVSPNPKP